MKPTAKQPDDSSPGADPQAAREKGWGLTSESLIPVVALSLMLLVLIGLTSEATHDSDRFGELYSLLLLLNALVLAGLTGILAWSLFGLGGQLRSRVPGARLTLRLLVLFAALAVTPVTVVYYFSLKLLNEGIDSWFDVRIERALDDALELSRTALRERMRERLKQTEHLARELRFGSTLDAAAALDDARSLSGAFELALLTGDGRLIASSNVNPASVVPQRPSETVLLQVRQTGNYINVEPVSDLGLFVRVALSLEHRAGTASAHILHALYPITEKLQTLADSVQAGYADYRELAFLRSPLKLSFSLTLSVVVLLSLLTACWAALRGARRFVLPLQQLAQGTRAVSRGELETRLPKSTQDEIGFLVESFNDMTAALQRAQSQTRASQNELVAQQRYLETVMATLSSGVITVDAEGKIRTCTRAAARILETSSDSFIGRRAGELVQQLPPLAAFFHSISETHAGATWQRQLALDAAGSRKIIVVSGAPLGQPELVEGESSADANSIGQVIVFDDVTALVEAQRNAAWSEVARRLAHEIKNPLTPIQLSAERLRHKYLDSMAGKDRDTLDRLTRTIVQQVDALKSMVNAFSDYARMPALALQEIALNSLVQDVVELYQEHDSSSPVTVDLDPQVDTVSADPNRIRQVLHNLIKNALEASPPGEPVQVRTSNRQQDQVQWIEITVSDRGTGFSDEIVHRAFEPYVTSKVKGTGLGLAIVRKIMEEHGGSAEASNQASGGALLTVRFPARASQSSALSSSNSLAKAG